MQLAQTAHFCEGSFWSELWCCQETGEGAEKPKAKEKSGGRLIVREHVAEWAHRKLMEICWDQTIIQTSSSPGPA